MRKFTLKFIGLLFFTVSVAQALPLNLTHGEVVVADQTRQVRQHALSEALGQVLVKVTGNPGVVTLPAVQSLLDQPARLVVSYHYQPVASSDEEDGWQLQVIFSRQAVVKALVRAGQSIWSEQRPAVLVWLEVPGEDAQAMLLSEGGEGRWLSAVQKAAMRRGLPITLPHANALLEQLDVSAREGLIQRYGVRALLVGHLSDEGLGQLSGDWLWQFDGEALSWHSAPQALDVMMGAAIDRVTDALVSHLAVGMPAAGAQTLLLRVVGIGSGKDYALLLQYLQHIDAVSELKVLAASEEGLWLQLASAGGLADLKRRFLTQKHWQALPSLGNGQMGVPVAGLPVLTYQWFSAVAASPAVAVSDPAANSNGGLR